MIWQKKISHEYSVENFYKEEKRLNELEFVYFETPRIMAEVWMLGLVQGLPVDLNESHLVLELKKNPRFVSVKFERENFCILASLVDGSIIELCTGTYIFDEEKIPLPKMRTA